MARLPSRRLPSAFLAFSWGALMGFAVTQGRIDAVALVLYAGSIAYLDKVGVLQVAAAAAAGARHGDVLAGRRDVDPRHRGRHVAGGGHLSGLRLVEPARLHELGYPDLLRGDRPDVRQRAVGDGRNARGHPPPS